MKVVKSIDKGDLEALLNVIVTEAAWLANATPVDADEKKVREFFNMQMQQKANRIAYIASQALHAWDMEEYSLEANDDYDLLMKQARKKSGNFEQVEWEG